MSYKFDSLVIILNKLDSGTKVTAESLREELEVSKRTVHRYIRTLVTAGFPIDYDRDNKTYAFTGGYTLKKPNISLEEALAFSLARKMLSSFGPGMEKSLGSIEEKLAVAHPPDLKHIVLSPETVPTGTEQYLAPIHRAIINFQKIPTTSSFGTASGTSGDSTMQTKPCGPLPSTGSCRCRSRTGISYPLTLPRKRNYPVPLVPLSMESPSMWS
jgi:biotin operon repressor